MHFNKNMVYTTICILVLSFLSFGASQNSSPPVFASSQQFPVRSSIDNSAILESQRLITEKAEKFAFQFLKQVSDAVSAYPNKSYMVSPFALWSLLLLIAEAAKGNTLQELLTTLHLDRDPHALRSAYSKIAEQLKVNTNTIEVAAFQALFTDINRPVNRDYENLVSRIYDSALISVDFSDVNNTLKSINDDINKATRGLLPHTVTPQDFKEASLLMISSLYFKGKWKFPFKEAHTQPAPFHNENGQVLGTVQMMTKAGPFNYVNMKELDSFVLELPYGVEDRLSMLILLPKRSVSLNKVMGKLANVGTKKIISELNKAAALFQEDDLVDLVEVSIPKFTTTSHFNLKPILANLGIYDIFDASLANLDSMAKNIYVGNIFQSTRIIVNEEGTEAGAVTTAVLVNKASPTKFYVDRPFGYVIVEKKSGLLLFAGEVRSHEFS